jgi:hypothetical protein
MHSPFSMTRISPAARDFFAPEQTPQEIIPLQFALPQREGSESGQCSGIEGE